MRLQVHGRSSTLDILGPSRRNGKVPSKWAELHARLTELREQVASKRDLRTQSAQVDEAAGSVEHIADAATDAYDRDWALALVSSDQNILFEIDHALDRLHRGSYGTCELTGQPIESARLRAIPWTRYSASAQAELEAKGGASRLRVGVVGLVQFTEGDASASEGADEEETAPSLPKAA